MRIPLLRTLLLTVEVVNRDIKGDTNNLTDFRNCSLAKRTTTTNRFEGSHHRRSVVGSHIPVCVDAPAAQGIIRCPTFKTRHEFHRTAITSWSRESGQANNNWNSFALTSPWNCCDTNRNAAEKQRWKKISNDRHRLVQSVVFELEDSLTSIFNDVDFRFYLLKKRIST